jgi:hypothetical protein
LSILGGWMAAGGAPMTVRREPLPPWNPREPAWRRYVGSGVYLEQLQDRSRRFVDFHGRDAQECAASVEVAEAALAGIRVALEGLRGVPGGREARPRLLGRLEASEKTVERLVERDRCLVAEFERVADALGHLLESVPPSLRAPARASGGGSSTRRNLLSG